MYEYINYAGVSVSLNILGISMPDVSVSLVVMYEYINYAGVSVSLNVLGISLADVSVSLSALCVS
jgi:hypothetical protein